MTKRDILTSALREIAVLDPADTMLPEDADQAADAFDRLLDDWNADDQAIYATQKLPFTLTPSLNPHTIGAVGATWTTTQRPESIDAVNLIFTSSTPTFRRPINPRDKQWYQGLTVPALSTAIPTDYFYDADWPLGKLYFYPVPSGASDVEIWCRIILAALAIDDSFDLPPGYRSAVMLSVAEACAEPFGRPWSDRQERAASKARARIFNNNRITPRLATRDAGMPRTHNVRNFNVLDRSFR